ncbi:MAG: cadherin-like domain-containing protein [Verrucomicrobia bacterium]|nr:cadherin-like domain-containing protein [Verrucomicrobiota bacterium]
MKTDKQTILAVLTCWLVNTSFGILPDQLTLDVGDIDGDGVADNLVLAKRSLRGPDYRVLSWDPTTGYTEVATPEVRTYRGHVEGDPSMRVNAVIEPGNVLQAFLSDGRNVNVKIEGLPVSISGPEGTADPGSGNVAISRTVNRTSPTPRGYIIPQYTMRKMHVGVDIANDYYVGIGGSLEAAVARVESRINDADFFYARDMGIAWQIQECVVRVGAEPDNWKTWWTSETPVYINSKMKFKWPGGGGSSGRVFNSLNINQQHTCTLGSSSAFARSLGHEIAHGYGAGHASSWEDTMGGSESCLGGGTVQRMIDHSHMALEAAAPAITYGSPLPPYAMEDGANTQQDTPVDIDLLENDYDGNGDAIHLEYVDAATEKGGTVSVVSGGTVRYTPPTGFLGMDEFAYHVADAGGLENRQGYVKVYVRNNGLATHILFDETTGTAVHDVGPYQAHGTLESGLVFSNSLTGKIGNALYRGDGIDDTKRAEFPGVGDPMDGSLSVSLWVKYTQTPIADGTLACKGGAVIPGRIDAPRGGWFIAHYADGKFHFGGNMQRDLSGDVDENSEMFDRYALETILPNVWYHLVMVLDRDNQTIRAWVNNSEVTDSDWSTVVPDGMIESSHSPLVLFDAETQQDQGNDTPCMLDDVRIYNKVLTAQEIAALYAATDEIPAGAPVPADWDTGVLSGGDLGWMPGKPSPTYEFDVYFGVDYNAVLNATTNSAEYQGRQSAETHAPTTAADTEYFWRIDEVTASSAIVAGRVWRFKTVVPETGLSEPPLANPSFENPALISGAADDDIKEWYDAVAYTYTADEGASTHPDTPYGENWAEIDKGRWMYQQIGHYRENMDLEISFLLGTRSDKQGHTVYVQLLAGGDPGLAADVNVKNSTDNPLVSTVGATVITTSANIPELPQGTIAEQAIQLSTGTGLTVGAPLWLQFHTVDQGTSDRVLIDNVQVVDVTVDSDADGMPDMWEEQYFTNGIAALPGGNADGDAHSNLEEYISGMDPTNEASFFHIADSSMEGGSGFVITWDSFSERWYQVNWAPSLTNAFTNLADLIEFPQNSYTDSVHHVDGQGFYRIDVRLK